MRASRCDCFNRACVQEMETEDTPMAACYEVFNESTTGGLEWQISMLNDAERNAAYDTALREALARMPGATVLDIGAGCGILSMMAARAGAGRVLGCEVTQSLAEKATEIVAGNGLADRVRIVNKHSEELEVGPGKDLEERAQVLVAEIVDSGLLGEGLWPVYRDARARLLAPGAAYIPAGALVHAALVECPDLRRRQYLRGALLPHAALSAPCALLRFDFASDALPAPAEAALTVERAGQVDGVMFWIELAMGPGGAPRLSLDPTLPGAAARAHWCQGFHPLPRPLPVSPGQRLRLLARASDTEISFALEGEAPAPPAPPPGLLPLSPHFFHRLSDGSRLGALARALARALAASGAAAGRPGTVLDLGGSFGVPALLAAAAAAAAVAAGPAGPAVPHVFTCEPQPQRAAVAAALAAANGGRVAVLPHEAGAAVERLPASAPPLAVLDVLLCWSALYGALEAASAGAWTNARPGPRPARGRGGEPGKRRRREAAAGESSGSEEDGGEEMDLGEMIARAFDAQAAARDALRLVPCGATLWAAPLSSPALVARFQRIERGATSGLDVTAMDEVAQCGVAQELDILGAGEYEHLAAPQPAARFDFRAPIEPFRSSLAFPIERPGTVHAIHMWIEVHADEQESYATGPHGLAYRQILVFLPYYEGVQAGGTLAAVVQMDESLSLSADVKY
eukprot:tig00000388_g24816.t1